MSFDRTDVAPPRRLRGDDGTALIEFALVAPVLIVLVLGLIEFGTFWREQNLLVRSSQSASRTGATQGTQRYADYNTLQSIRSSLSALDNSTIDKVIIYRADSADGRVPAACKSIAAPNDLTAKGSAANRCNVYSQAQVDYAGSPLSVFRGTDSCSGGSWDAFWCPSNRSRGTDVSDPDYVGVYVQVSYETVSGLLTDTLTASATAVFRLEPCITGVSCGV